MNRRTSPKALRGNGLLRAVYAELFMSLGEIYSPKDILLAAQKLIDISKDEYAESTFQDEVAFSGYYTRDTYFMISSRPWTLVEYEESSFDFDDDDKNSNRRAEMRLKSLHNPDRYYHRG